jgi:hypothetical protein
VDFADTHIGRLIDAVGVRIGFAAGDDARFLRGGEKAAAKATLDLFLLIVFLPFQGDQALRTPVR